MQPMSYYPNNDHHITWLMFTCNSLPKRMKVFCTVVNNGVPQLLQAGLECRGSLVSQYCNSQPARLQGQHHTSAKHGVHSLIMIKTLWC